MNLSLLPIILLPFIVVGSYYTVKIVREVRPYREDLDEYSTINDRYSTRVELEPDLRRELFIALVCDLACICFIPLVLATYYTTSSLILHAIAILDTVVPIVSLILVYFYLNPLLDLIVLYHDDIDEYLDVKYNATIPLVNKIDLLPSFFYNVERRLGKIKILTLSREKLLVVSTRLEELLSRVTRRYRIRQIPSLKKFIRLLKRKIERSGRDPDAEELIILLNYMSDNTGRIFRLLPYIVYTCLITAGSVVLVGLGLGISMLVSMIAIMI
ncbi:MAG: hypothetical protein GXO26_02895, partial [Crenarchaeota archaeon]|nr:hypothetical protein [Thermoproteota archaeon]